MNRTTCDLPEGLSGRPAAPDLCWRVCLGTWEGGAFPERAFMTRDAAEAAAALSALDPRAMAAALKTRCFASLERFSTRLLGEPAFGPDWDEETDAELLALVDSDGPAPERGCSVACALECEGWRRSWRVASGACREAAWSALSSVDDRAMARAWAHDPEAPLPFEASAALLGPGGSELVKASSAGAAPGGKAARP